MTRKPRFENVGAGKGVKRRLDVETLSVLYTEQRLTQAEIAQRYDCSPQFVSLLVREYGIVRYPANRHPRSSRIERYDN